MQTKILKNITVLFALLFSVGLFAQNIEVMEINKKIELSPEEEGEHINFLAFGAPSSVFMNDGEAQKRLRGWESILSANLNHQTELTSLADAFGNEMYGIEIINMYWSDSMPFTFDSTVLGDLSNLKYVFIRSYNDLDENSLRSSLSSLMTQLENKGGVIVLYQSMKAEQ